ncbi:MAG: YfcE family phosphodiesterase [Gammaproteobacteria bacterium]
MKVCIVSDSHDNRNLLAAAVIDAKARGAEAVLHAGDVVAPSTLGVIKHLEMPIHVIHGNNTGDLAALSRLSHRDGNPVTYYGMDAKLELAGRRIFIVHYPHYARALALTGDWDVVIYGHDHAASIETVDNVAGRTTHLIDPGSVAGLDGPATYIMGDLERLEFELLAVPGATPQAPEVADTSA